MNKIVLSSMTCGVIFLCSSAIAADGEYCSNETLQGAYITFSNGRSGNQPGSAPIASAEMIYYNGKGRYTGSSVSADKTETSPVGSYKVSKNCEVEVRPDRGGSVTYFLAPSGEEFVWVRTSGGVQASASRRVSRSNVIAAKP